MIQLLYIQILLLPLVSGSYSRVLVKMSNAIIHIRVFFQYERLFNYCCYLDLSDTVVVRLWGPPMTRMLETFCSYVVQFCSIIVLQQCLMVCAFLITGKEGAASVKGISEASSIG